MLKRLQQMVVAVVALSFMGGAYLIPAYGQQQGVDEEALKEMQDLQRRSQKVQAQLDEIAREAQQRNPELGEMQQNLQELYRQKLEEYGYPSEEELEELRNMQARLQNSDDMDADERQRLTQDFQQKVTALQQAQQNAQQDEEVVKTLQKVDKAVSQAMQEISDKTPALQQQQRELQAEIQKLQQKHFQQQPQR